MSGERLHLRGVIGFTPQRVEAARSAKNEPSLEELVAALKTKAKGKGPDAVAAARMLAALESKKG